MNLTEANGISYLVLAESLRRASDSSRWSDITPRARPSTAKLAADNTFQQPTYFNLNGILLAIGHLPDCNERGWWHLKDGMLWHCTASAPLHIHACIHSAHIMPDKTPLDAWNSCDTIASQSCSIVFLQLQAFHACDAGWVVGSPSQLRIVALDSNRHSHNCRAVPYAPVSLGSIIQQLVVYTKRYQQPFVQFVTENNLTDSQQCVILPNVSVNGHRSCLWHFDNTPPGRLIGMWVQRRAVVRTR